MKKIKKWRLLSLLVFLALSFTGCTSGADTSENTEQMTEVVANIDGGQQQEEMMKQRIALTINRYTLSAPAMP